MEYQKLNGQKNESMKVCYEVEPAKTGFQVICKITTPDGFGVEHTVFKAKTLEKANSWAFDTSKVLDCSVELYVQ